MFVHNTVIIGIGWSNYVNNNSKHPFIHGQSQYTSHAPTSVRPSIEFTQ